MAITTLVGVDQALYMDLVSVVTAATLVKQHCWATKMIGFLIYSAKTIMCT